MSGQAQCRVAVSASVYTKPTATDSNQSLQCLNVEDINLETPLETWKTLERFGRREASAH